MTSLQHDITLAGQTNEEGFASALLTCLTLKTA
jgi:hypothetical protein